MALALGWCWGGGLPTQGRALDFTELETWAEGPVKWLLLPEELKRLRRIRDRSEAVGFIEEFWARRDPEPGLAGNPVREAFLQRVEAADVLYAETGLRGSLSDRGRALILLGPPTHVTVSNQPALAWDPDGRRRSRVKMRRVDVEIWGYRLEDLPSGLVELWTEQQRGAEEALALTLTFRTVVRRTTLVEGEALLESAARALLGPSREE